MWFVWPLFFPLPPSVLHTVRSTVSFSTIKVILHFDEAFFPQETLG